MSVKLNNIKKYPKTSEFAKEENVMEKVVGKTCMEFEELKRVQTLTQAQWQHLVA